MHRTRYQLQFRFDAEIPCRISVYFLADETKDPGTGRLLHRPRFAPQDDWVVGPHPFSAGSNQTYSTAALGYEGADLASKVGAAGVEGPCHIHIVIRPDDDARSGRCAGVGLVLAAIAAVYLLVRWTRPIREEAGYNLFM